MPSKIRLVCAPGSSPTLPYQRFHWERYFELVDFAPEYLVNDGRTAIIAYYTDIEHYRQYQLPLINDHLFDSGPLDPCENSGTELTLQGADWMWINSQWVFKQDYQTRSESVPDKFFLLLMNLARDHRDWLLDQTSPYLSTSIWSYVERGHHIQDDVFIQHPNHHGTANDLLYVPRWYSETCFSLVSESTVDALGMGYGSSALFVSEKSFKPLALEHPFVIQGTMHNLRYLKSLGFETFGLVLDETYDSIAQTRRRQQAVLDTVSSLFEEFMHSGSVLQTPTVKDIVKHNHSVFWDDVRVTKRFERNIVNVITNFVESQ